MGAGNYSRLGDILLKSGLVNEENLDLALKEQNQTDEKLGAVLQRLGIVTEKEIGRILASQAGVSHVSLQEEWIQKEAVEAIPSDFAEKHMLFPISIRGNTLCLAMANPMAIDVIDEAARLTGHYIEVVHATEGDIQDTQRHHYGHTADLNSLIEESIQQARQAHDAGVHSVEGDSPFVTLVDLIIRKGIDEKATDIHVEAEEKLVRCRYRIDGRLTSGLSMPKSLQSVLITRMKIMAGMNISETRIPQDGRIAVKHDERKIDLRVSTFPTVHGETIVSRILDKDTLTVGIDKIGMSKAVLKSFKRDITRPNGIILVTGPTGSGKTTTLYSALSFLNKPDVKMITLEDPVEYELPLINQGQVQPKQGFTFAAGLRAILRQDPDILLVGEIRDQETAQLAIRAALTGHLVFSTLHTNDAVGAIPRLIDMGIEPFLLSATLIGIIAQRLVRSICPVCRISQAPTEEQLELLNLDMKGGESTFTIGRGCPACRDTGYKGRQAVFEYLRLDEKIRKLINSNATRDEILELALENGMNTLRNDTMDKVLRGRTSLNEMMRVVA
ncbi:MAG: type II/IV secretion system protein [bacterium]|nr:type II/IV secretion system protein [bacterium]